MKRFSGLTRAAIAASAVALLAAGCSGGASQSSSGFAPAAVSRPSAATYRPMIDARGVMSQWPQGFVPNGLRRASLRVAPDAVKTSVAVAQFGGSSVLWFDNINNKKNTRLQPVFPRSRPTVSAWIATRTCGCPTASTTP